MEQCEGRRKLATDWNAIFHHAWACRMRDALKETDPKTRQDLIDDLFERLWDHCRRELREFSADVRAEVGVLRAEEFIGNASNTVRGVFLQVIDELADDWDCDLNQKVMTILQQTWFLYKFFGGG